ncbi:MAG TPA: tetratricopeptide repeat protein [Tepidisphaeraceae bacterium]|nr:tetratricopeptide repeat protein [Tepidisphaeraceae bacterium]
MNNPDGIEASRVQLAAQILRRGDARKSAELCNQILDRNPKCVDALRILTFIARSTGPLDYALTLARRCVETGSCAQDHVVLGEILRELNRSSEAATEFEKAIELDPRNTAAMVCLGHLRAIAGQSAQAEQWFQRALELNPQDIFALNNLALVLVQSHRFGEAIALLNRAVEIEPNGQAWANLGSALLETGRIDQAIEAYERGMSVEGPFGHANHGLLLALLHSDRHTPEQVFVAHRTWGRNFASASLPPVRDRTPTRQLRIGYVSSDFRQHALQYFIEPILIHHNRAEFEVTCYSGVTPPDDITARLRSLSHRWIDVGWLSDASLADQIRTDRIDILVDLSAHSAGSRLAAFAAKPAPIQISYLGYAATTGLVAMDYRISDAILDPPGLTEHLHAERLLRLPDIFWCYQPDKDAPDIVDRAPDSQGIVFGSLNRLAKITPAAISLWSKILTGVPGSRLMLMASGLADESARQSFEAHFASHGIDPARLILRGPGTPEEYMAALNDVDIGLDTYPFNGGTTTCHALWMGVPVITLAGTSPISRTGATILNCVGLSDLIAQSPEGYVSCSIQLAKNMHRLQSMRRELRSRLRTSPLCDAPRFVRNLESAYRSAWQEYSSLA